MATTYPQKVFDIMTDSNREVEAGLNGCELSSTRLDQSCPVYLSVLALFLFSCFLFSLFSFSGHRFFGENGVRPTPLFSSRLHERVV